MSRFVAAVRTGGAGLLAAVLLASCTSGSPDGPLPTEASGDDVVCGMATKDVQTATGLDVGRVVGDLSDVVDDDGTRVCEVWPADQGVVDGAIVLVQMVPTASVAGGALREQVDAAGPSDDPPDETFEGLDAAGWLGAAADDEPGMTPTATPAPTPATSATADASAGTAGGTVVLVSGQTAIKVTTAVGAAGRDTLDDALALAQQVASTPTDS